MKEKQEEFNCVIHDLSGNGSLEWFERSRLREKWGGESEKLKKGQ